MITDSVSHTESVITDYILVAAILDISKSRSLPKVVTPADGGSKIENNPHKSIKKAYSRP